MRIEPRYSSVIVSLFGKFNPQELTPAWFAQRDLLTRDMADAAEVEEGNDGIVFTSDWLRFMAEPQRISIETSQVPYVRAFDLMARMFGEHLYRTTDLAGFSLSRNALFFPSDVQLFDRIARNIVAFDKWSDMNTEASGPQSNESPASFMVAQLHQDDFVLLRMERGANPFCIGVELTEKRMSECGDSPKDGSLVRSLWKRFDAFIARADKTIDQMMSSGVSEEG